MTRTTAGTTERLRAHAPEVLGVLAVLGAVRVTGVASPGPAWLLPTLVVVAVVVSAATYARWGRDADGSALHLRVALQVAALTALAAASGAGPALVGPVLLLAVTDTVRYSGARAGSIAVGWALAAIAAHQTVLASFELPTLLAGTIGHGIAALGALVVVLVGQRIARLAADGEAAQQRTAQEQARIRAMLAGASDVTLIIGDGEITYQSPSTQRVMGYPTGTLLGRGYLDLIHPDDRARAVDFVRELIDQPGGSGLLACRLEAADGTYVPVESSCRNLLHDEAVRGFVVSARDVTERRLLEAQLEHRAFHDDLTGLANRSLLLDRLEHTGARLGRTGGRYAVLYVDLDGFKPINDTFGHVAGDAVLRAVARRLEAATRRSDTVARLGGDEFAILLEEHHEPVDAARVAERILEDVRRPILADGADVQVTASIGIAYDDDGDQPTDVLRNADIAMYLSKRDGKDRFEVFEPQMHLAVVERLHLESDLQRALDNDELRCHYQPIVTLSDRRIVGVEALVRWEHPERGTVAPGQFIPLAEETGLIVGIGRFVLHEACAQAAAWRRDLPGAEDLTVSVNVSMRQFSAGDLLEDVASALAASGLPPAALTLELTESALVHDAERTLAVLQQLKELGVRLAIDDFGTGYSSLAYLHRFPVDVLKIDRSFVTSVVSGRQSPALARAIVDLGRSLDLLTVAEGIEHDTELDQFRELDCALGQGYLFARPADAATIAAALSSSLGPDAVVLGSAPDLAASVTPGVSVDVSSATH
ncbi:putative bifunctional diguanylate cyclase/phosphodiesterase [Nitriliruptor alkaliphilus]|uniref:putative bifunctional diguanylate cyclase/phosphodiesterase n=1 Tax=Nitriliruptor alkaliphilus TaxID=427918 RepID=UPI000698EE4F|nr:EAL domain-containing protein [Nitriliruptor alkaliphilus]